MKIAVIDSGIHEGHPHVGAAAASVHFTNDGIGDDPVDRLGHGTAVAAAIREKVPDAELFAVKVFDRRLTAPIGALLRALDWCRQHRMDVVNLSLGTANPEHRDTLIDAVRGNAVVVSGAHMLPGVSRAWSAWMPARVAHATASAIATACFWPHPIRGPSQASRGSATCKDSASP
ncbi:MAG: S8 family serine peptidase [Bryobacteraceae bacterium]